MAHHAGGRPGVRRHRWSHSWGGADRVDGAAVRFAADDPVGVDRHVVAVAAVDWNSGRLSQHHCLISEGALAKELHGTRWDK